MQLPLWVCLDLGPGLCLAGESHLECVSCFFWGRLSPHGPTSFFSQQQGKAAPPRLPTSIVQEGFLGFSFDKELPPVS